MKAPRAIGIALITKLEHRCWSRTVFGFPAKSVHARLLAGESEARE
jgi:hypothetical protein